MQIYRTDISRIDLSELIVSGWEEVDIGATPSEYLRLIASELEALKGIRHEDPDRVDVLMTRYAALGQAMRLRIT